jgi:hypothetical protein
MSQVIKKVYVKRTPVAVCRSLAYGVKLFEGLPMFKPFKEKFLKTFPNPSKALGYLLSSHWEYIGDGNEEQFRAPWVMEELKGGDCDDLSIYSAIVARFYGLRYRFILQGKTKKEIEHVLTQWVDGSVIDTFGDVNYKTS